MWLFYFAQVTAADELAQGVDAVQQAVSTIERFGKSEALGLLMG